jgi:hypothetical protein
MGVMSDEERMDALLRQLAAEEYNRPPEIVPREQMWEAVRSGIGGSPAKLGRWESGIEGDPSLRSGQAGNREQETVLPFRSRVPRWVYYAVAAVLLLALGVQVGRVIGPSPASQTAVVPKGAQRDSLGRTPVSPDSASVVAPRRDLVSDDGAKGPPKPKSSGPERQLTPDTPDDVRARAYTVATAQHLTEAEAMLTAFKGDLSQGRMDAEISAWGKDLLSNTRLLLDSPAARDPVRRKLLQDLELVLVQIVQLSPKSSARDRDLIKGALTDDQVLTRLRTAIPVKGT